MAKLMFKWAYFNLLLKGVWLGPPDLMQKQVLDAAGLIEVPEGLPGDVLSLLMVFDLFSAYFDMHSHTPFYSLVTGLSLGITHQR